jgi:phosphatidate cytidylyltransferase
MEKILTNKELLQRVLTACFFVPLMLFIIIIGGWLYKALFIAITFGSFIELKNLIKKDRPWIALSLLTSFFLSLFLISMILLREKGLEQTLFLILLVWTTDTMAYFGGKIIGGKKLAPKISPKKTISGFLAGLISASLLGYFYQKFHLLNFYNEVGGILIALYLSALSQLGDLLESALKRYFDVKDSGKILPGHGGLLDRFDGMILASVANLPLIFL